MSQRKPALSRTRARGVSPKARRPRGWQGDVMGAGWRLGWSTVRLVCGDHLRKASAFVILALPAKIAERMRRPASSANAALRVLDPDVPPRAIYLPSELSADELSAEMIADGELRVH